MTYSKTFSPGATIGVLGGGQLGRMFAFAARQMGFRIHVYAPDLDPPARFAADEFTRASYEDESALKRFASVIDVATVEFENVPSAALQVIDNAVPVRPGPRILEIAQNRLREKTTLVDLGIPTAPFASARSSEEIGEAVERIGLPVVVKTVTSGYDGKGQIVVEAGASLHNIWQELKTNVAIVEARIDLALEFSVISARSPDGGAVSYRPIVNHHRHHTLDISATPAEEIPPRLQAEAVDIAEKIARELDLVGLLCVEFFLARDGRMLVNEIAPRPHNSGHLTIEAHRTSQFEQQVRAVTGLPLGSTRQVRYAAMANLLGDLWSDGPPDFSESLKIPNVKLHLYGKSVARRGRKMGHLTATANDRWTAETNVNLARSLLCKRRARSALNPV